MVVLNQELGYLTLAKLKHTTDGSVWEFKTISGSFTCGNYIALVSQDLGVCFLKHLL